MYGMTPLGFYVPFQWDAPVAVIASPLSLSRLRRHLARHSALHGDLLSVCRTFIGGTSRGESMGSTNAGVCLLFSENKAFS